MKKKPAPARKKVPKKRPSLRISFDAPVLFRVCLAVVLAAIVTSFYVTLASRSAGWVNYSFPDLKEGDITPRREIAPFDFSVPKSERQLELERRLAVESVLPVFRYNESAYDRVIATVDSIVSDVAAIPNEDLTEPTADSLAMSLPVVERASADSVIRYLIGADTYDIAEIRTAIHDSYDNVSELLIVPSDSYLDDFSEDRFVLENGDTVSVEMTISVEEAARFLDISFRNAADELISGSEGTALTGFIRQFLVPNLVYDNQLSSERRRAARDAVPVDLAQFQRNERLIDANVPVTAEQLVILDALKREAGRRSFLENRLQHYTVAVGKSLVGIGILGVFVVFLFLYRRSVFHSFPKLLLAAIILFIPLFVAHYAVWGGAISPYLVPVAITAILMTILFDAGLGIMATLAASLIVASFIDGGTFRFAVIYFLSGSAGVFTVGHVRHRKEFYRSMIAIPFAMALSIAATHDWIAHTSMGELGNEMFLGALNGFFCPIIAIGLLPVFESLFKMTTDITLLELSDMNNPLLRELAVNAPGTFSSVVVVGMLAEAAAEKVAANPLLCRVGAYYHDIGKTTNADYFIENQTGRENPHDKLTPHMSALVLTSHVKEGYELGVRYGLPESVLDIIQQHHGTSLMQSFYHKAVEEQGEENVDESSFRYPGPRPQTREAAIVMLADLSEAASRTVKEKSAGRLKTLISTIIQKRFLDGELDESELTLKDLHNIEESFLPILVSSHHGRIEYPWQKGEEAQEPSKTPTGELNAVKSGKEDVGVDSV